MAQALVPLKDLVEAKSRLAGLLNPSERRALAQAMVEDVLAVLSSHPDIDAVTLVSDDPCAGLLANQYGIDCWPEAVLGCRGLNALVSRASERLLAAGDEPLLVLHGDLPMLEAADISAVLSCQQQLQGLVIACDTAGTGTNLLAFGADSMPVFQFGLNSCQRHVESAAAAGQPVVVLERGGLALDIDEPADLQALIAALGHDFQAVVDDVIPRGGRDGVTSERARHTAGLLCDTPLGSRIKLALATLDGGADSSSPVGQSGEAQIS